MPEDRSQSGLYKGRPILSIAKGPERERKYLSRFDERAHNFAVYGQLPCIHRRIGLYRQPAIFVALYIPYQDPPSTAV